MTQRPHIVDGEFQSDKYPTCPRGKVPLSVKDPTAQDLLWEYAQRRRAVDSEFADDLEFALREAGYGTAQCSLGSLTCGRERDVLRSEVVRLQTALASSEDCVGKLERRREELLQTIASISQTEPLPDEVDNALKRQGALLAEIGTLRAQLAEAVDARQQGLAALETYRLAGKRWLLLKQQHEDELNVLGAAVKRGELDYDAAVAERDAARAEVERLRKKLDEERDRVDKQRTSLAQRIAEVERLRAIRDLAANVVGERHAKIMHARESTAMCRLARAINEACKEIS